MYQCTSVPVVSINSLARAYMYSFRKRLVHWYIGTVVSEEEGESDNRASVFWGCLLPYKTHVSREWRGIKNLARAMPSQRKEGFIRRNSRGVRVRNGTPPR